MCACAPAIFSAPAPAARAASSSWELSATAGSSPATSWRWRSSGWAYCATRSSPPAISRREPAAMPMPTPPRPGEEPLDEPSLYRYHLRRLITWFVEALDSLPPEAFSWRPPATEANTLAAICVHAISSAEWWVLSCVGDGPIERNRDAEFQVDVSWQELRPRFQSSLEHADALLAGMPSEQLGALSRHPAGDRMNRRCLIHTVEHLGLHLGHVEITSDWWKARHSAG